MFGGDLPSNDDFTLSLLTNDEVLAVNQGCMNGREFSDDQGHIVWVADIPGSQDKYVALFNTRDAADNKEHELVTISLLDLGFSDICGIRDLWMHKDLDPVKGTFSSLIPYHGAGLFRVGPINHP